uniref:Putative MFS general substrate transporter n=1 Tax=Moniliophthora roreri TaxID=221103 RepID=A0A0W0GCK8_MONRR
MAASSLHSSDTDKSRPLRSYIWDTWDKPPEERKFLHRLDSFLLTYAALSYFSKYLDQQNITNAYVSGMKEDLNLYGNELNYIVTAWTCGYVIGQIPSNLLITRIRPSIWVPTMEVVWSVLTMVLATSKTFTQILVLRFFIGLAESTFYPAIQYVIGSWYKPEELGKRACIFHTASAIGPMFSGFLQTAAYNGLNNVHGLPGWKLYVLFNNGSGPATAMIFWFKSFNTPDHIVYTVGQINLYPLGQNVVQVVTTLIWAWWSDAMRKRWPPMLVSGTILFVTCFVLAFTPLYENIARRWVFYYLTTVTGGCSGLILAWANELTGHDSEKRSFVVASCNTIAYCFQAWLPIVLFPQVEQPRVFKGNLASAGIIFGMMSFAMATLYFQKRDERRAKKQSMAQGTTNLNLDEERSSIAKD